MAHPTSRTLNETKRQDVPGSSDTITRKADAKGRFETRAFENLKSDKEGRLWVNSDVLAQRLDAVAILLEQLLTEIQLQNEILTNGLNVKL